MYSSGRILTLNTKNTLIFGDKRLVAVMGVQDLVIVDTEDVVMVCFGATGTGCESVG